jgi:LmbE family N-acetylglucosaminyl deacetylase
MRRRVAEDEAALGLAGRRAENLDFFDSQYRDGEPGDVAGAVRDRLADDALVLAPAAIGGHSDHKRVRDAGLALAAEGREVVFYADLPYATAFGWPSWLTRDDGDPFLDVDAYCAESVPPGYEPTPVELSEELQRSKVQAMQAYRSQFPALEAGVQRRLTHPALIRFEMVWVRPGGGYTAPTAGL